MSLSTITGFKTYPPLSMNSTTIQISPAVVEALRIEKKNTLDRFQTVPSTAYLLGLNLIGSIDDLSTNSIDQFLNYDQATNILVCHLTIALFVAVNLKNQYAIKKIGSLSNAKSIAPKDLVICLYFAIKADNQYALQYIINHPNAKNITPEYLGFILIQAAMLNRFDVVVTILGLSQFKNPESANHAVKCLSQFDLNALNILDLNNKIARQILFIANEIYHKSSNH